MLERAESLSDKYYEKIVSSGHQIRMYPELESEEENTARLVCEILDGYGIKYEKNMTETGVLASIEGKELSTKKTQCVLLGADMDALPAQEGTNLSYASKINEKMYTCGHNGRTTEFLGAVLILSELKDEFSGAIRFMSQPAEEEGGGTKPMIEAGILKNSHVDAVLGCYLWGPSLENTAQIVSSEMMAGVDVFDLEFIGKGGHGVRPHTTIDPIVMASRFVGDVQCITSRRLRPVDTGVITVGKFHAGAVFNVIP